MRLLVGALLFGLSQGGREDNATKPLTESEASIDARLQLVKICPEVTTKCDVPKVRVAEISDLAAALDCMLKVNISTVEPGPCYDALKTFQSQVGGNVPAQAPFPFSLRPSTPFPMNIQPVPPARLVFIRGDAQQSPSQVPMMGLSIARSVSMGSQVPMRPPAMPSMGSQSAMGMRPAMGLQFSMRMRPSMGSQVPMRPLMMGRPLMGMRSSFMRDDDASWMGRSLRYAQGPRQPFWMDDEDDDRMSWRNMPRRPPMGMQPPFSIRDSRSPFPMRHRSPFPMRGDSRPSFMGRFHGPGPQMPFWMDDEDDDDFMGRFHPRPFWMNEVDDDEDRKPFWMSRTRARSFHGPPQKPFWMNHRMSRWEDDDDDDDDEEPSWNRWNPRDSKSWGKYGSYRSKSWKSSHSSRKYDSDHDNEFQYKFAYKPSFHMSMKGSPTPYMRPTSSRVPPSMLFSRSSMQGHLPRGMPSQGHMPQRMAPRRGSLHSQSSSPSMLMLMLPQLMGGKGPQNPMSSIMQVMLQSKLLAARNNDADYDYDYDTVGDDYDYDAASDYDYDYDSSSSGSSTLLIHSLLQNIGRRSKPAVVVTEVPAVQGERPVEVTQKPALEFQDPTEKGTVKEALASEQVSYRSLP